MSASELSFRIGLRAEIFRELYSKDFSLSKEGFSIGSSTFLSCSVVSSTLISSIIFGIMVRTGRTGSTILGAGGTEAGNFTAVMTGMMGTGTFTGTITGKGTFIGFGIITYTGIVTGAGTGAITGAGLRTYSSIT